MIAVLHEQYTKAIRDAIREKEVFIGAGKAESFEMYRNKCGEVAGLKKALDLFNDVVKRHGEMEDDE